MRWTRTFLPTLRNDPADVENPGHRWMIRAGLGRPAPGGEWNHFPLGFRVLKNINRIVRGEMNSLDAVEVQIPDSGKIFSVIGNDLQSWRQFPLVVHQAGRAWSFDLNDRERNKTGQKIYDAYIRIFARTALEIRTVESVSGEELHLLSPSGGDVVLTCSGCNYAATRDKAECRKPGNPRSPLETTELFPIKEVSTPGKTTVEEVSTFLKVLPADILKTLILRTEKGFLAGIVRGDHELNLAKLKAIAGVEKLELASPEEILKVTGGPVGFSGPVGLSIPLHCDREIEHLSNLVTGANKPDMHFQFVNREKDFKGETWADLRMARSGDGCPRCGEVLEFTKGYRVARLSRVDPGFTTKSKQFYVDAKGNRLPIFFGVYEIIPGQILSAMVERHRDGKGILWPEGLAPFPLELVTLNPKGDLRLDEMSRDLYEDFRKAKIDVLWDDRDLSPGVKFNDADLIGFPLRAVLGKRTIDNGTVDLQYRNNPEVKTVPLGSVLEAVQNALATFSL